MSPLYSAILLFCVTQVFSKECGVRNRVGDETNIEYPWHAGIYKDNGITYFCGGSIISNKAILTAAHCVYSDEKRKKIPVEGLRVAVGKFHKDWNNRDPHEQRFVVLEIFLRDTYLGDINRHEHDIAVLAINGSIDIKPTAMPVCIDEYSRYPVKKSDFGTVVGWGITGPEDTSDALRVAKLPFIDFSDCRRVVSASFSHFISYDKFCAGSHNGTHLGVGDSGVGLTFPHITGDNKEIHFLHGIASVRDENITLFTNITLHTEWVKKILSAIKYLKA